MIKCGNCKKENPIGSKFCVHCGATLEGMPASPDASKKKKPIKWGVVIPIIAAVLIVTSLAVLIITGVIQPFGLFSKDYLLIGIPNRDDEFDIFLVGTKESTDEGRELLEEVMLKNGAIIEDLAYFKPLGLNADGFGGFGKKRNEIFLQYYEDDDHYLEKTTIKGDDMDELFDSENNFTAVIPPQDDSIFLAEFEDDGFTLFYSREGDRLKEIEDSLRNAFHSNDMSKLLIVKIENDDDYYGENSAYVYTAPDFDDEIEVVSDEYLTDVGISGDGDFVHYVQDDPTSGEKTFHIFDVNEEKDVFEVGSEYDIRAFSSKEGGVVGYAVENEEGNIELYYYSSGESHKVDEALSVEARFNKAGTYIAYLTTEDEEQELFLQKVGSKEPTQVTSGTAMEFYFIGDEGILLIFDDDNDERIYSIYDIKSDALEEIFDGDYIIQVFHPSFFINKSRSLILPLYNREEDVYEVFAYQLNDGEGFFLKEEWNKLNILTSSNSGDALVFSAREDEDDDYALYMNKIVKGEKAERIDDEGEYGYSNAVFSSSGKELYFTAITGEDTDNIDVMKAVIKKDGFETETLHREAFIIDASWVDRDKHTDVVTYEGISMEGISFCPGAISIGIDDEVEASLKTDGSACYKVSVNAGEVYSYSASSDNPLDITVYNRAGNVLASSSDSSYRDPHFFYAADESGKHYIKITEVDGEAASFTFNISTGTGYSDFDAAEYIQPGTEIHGHILNNDRVYNLQLLNFDWDYADIYYFDGEEGDTVKIDATGETYGSSLDTAIILFSPTLEKMDYDDDGGSGYESRIQEDLHVTGRYYIVVSRYGGNYGYDEDYFYDLVIDIW